ncbi:hypothetical protein LSH36_427g04010, partial [Paralvinella palmiformis]
MICVQIYTNEPPSLFRSSALEGMNSTGNKLIVKKVYENLPLPNASCDGMLKN